MSAPLDRLVSDGYADRLLQDAERALSHPDTLSIDGHYFAAAVYALCRDRQARQEMAATAVLPHPTGEYPTSKAGGGSSARVQIVN